jgi:hypothetical protein
MAETIRRDRDHFASAPEEAATESWVEDPGIYLTIPRGDTMRQKVDRTSTADTSAVRSE